jgi:hypothetical protein
VGIGAAITQILRPAHRTMAYVALSRRMGRVAGRGLNYWKAGRP